MSGDGGASSVDFPVVGRVTVKSTRHLVEMLAARRDDAPPVRLAGRLTRQREVPAPDAPVHILSLAGLDRILRLEPDDLTCTVEAGVTRAELDAELASHRLWLPCEGGGGSIGATFATAAALGEAPGPTGSVSPRALLLGISGVLAEGRGFKVGARVVKSVAGFDLHKLFVGSRGRLFAATELHLKLRPMPRCRVAFRNDGLEPEAAISLFDRLRRDDVPPARLWLSQRGGNGGFAVLGRYDGAARVVADRIRHHSLQETASDTIGPIEGAPERVSGSLPPSRVRALLASIPAGSQLRIAGTGRFELGLTSAAADAVLQTIGALRGAAEIDRAPPGRRGLCTAIDPGAARLERRLREALDPKGVLR